MPRSAGHSTSSRSDGDICTGSLVFGERHPGPSRTDLMSAGLVCCMQDNIFLQDFVRLSHSLMGVCHRAQKTTSSRVYLPRPLTCLSS